jgi:Domain of unknown function DUF29
MTISPIATAPPQLYEQDYHHWLETTAQQLRDGNLAALDIKKHLLEEIEDTRTGSSGSGDGDR